MVYLNDWINDLYFNKTRISDLPVSNESFYANLQIRDSPLILCKELNTSKPENQEINLITDITCCNQAILNKEHKSRDARGSPNKILSFHFR